MSFDLAIFHFFNNLAGQSRSLGQLIYFFAQYFQYFVGGFFILLLFISRDFIKRKSLAFGAAIFSIAISWGGITQIIRFFYDRPRPFSVYPIVHLFTNNVSSFPSGHAAFFFSLAMAVHFFSKRWGVVFFASASLIVLARIAAGVHYPSDILAGVVVGLFSAWLVNYFQKKFFTGS
ncbi:MAG: phosphatase PAP2 family protein [Candidatus Portnoybacteria bacterium]|nr:phosphatase PAP2 family protein [Candidatus Portnoybacteria bacterium]